MQVTRTTIYYYTLTRKISLAPTPPVAQYQLKAISAAGFPLSWQFITKDVLKFEDYVENETILKLKEPSGQVVWEYYDDKQLGIHFLEVIPLSQVKQRWNDQEMELQNTICSRRAAGDREKELMIVLIHYTHKPWVCIGLEII